MTDAGGTFQITSMDEDAYHETEGGPRLTRARGQQRFGGDIDGDGSVEWLMCYLPDGGAGFVGLQRIEGSLGGRAGSFVMRSVGEHDGVRSTGSWTVVPGSGTGELAGITGQGGFEAPGGPEATYRLEYRLD